MNLDRVLASKCCGAHSATLPLDVAPVAPRLHGLQKRSGHAQIAGFDAARRDADV